MIMCHYLNAKQSINWQRLSCYKAKKVKVQIFKQNVSQYWCNITVIAGDHICCNIDLSFP